MLMSNEKNKKFKFDKSGSNSKSYKSRDIVPNPDEEWYSNVKKSAGKGGNKGKTGSAEAEKKGRGTTSERPARKSTWDKSGAGPASDRPARKTWDKSGSDSSSERPARKSSWDKSGSDATSDRPARKSSRDSFVRPSFGQKPGFQNRDSFRDTKDDFADSDYPRRSAYKSRKESDSGIFEPDSMSAKDNSWRLNKYIANSGICSRREADAIIAEGKVKVNGKVVTEMGIKVTKKDRVTVDGSEINPEDFIYILLNKPKNYITTTDDEKDRATVMDLVKDATGLRVYPVGRLDRNTTGLLILTNDGDLSNRLMHPSYKVKKTYEVETAKPMLDDELNELLRGITLEDGDAKAHDIQRSYSDPNVIQMSIYEGRNRQVRRMIEYFRHEIVKLHRTYYAGLNVKGVRQGRWRFLRPKEVKDLRMLVKLFDLKQK